MKQYLNCSDMTYFAIICSTTIFQANLEVSEVLITYVINRGKLGQGDVTYRGRSQQ